MIIEINKEKVLYEKPKFNINESKYINKIDSLLNEECGNFKNQYLLAKELANVVIDNYKSGIYRFEYKPINNSIFKTVLIDLDRNALPNSSASINRINDEERLIGISISIPYRLMIDKQDIALKRIYDAITHELMHGYVYLNRMGNNVENVIDTPEWYEKLQILRNNVNYDSLVYKFSYAMYATYYQEVNAIVSQSKVQFHELTKNLEKNNKNYNKALKQCDSFQIYNMILHDVVPIIENMDDNEIFYYIVDIFNKFDINMNVNDIRNECKRIKKVSEYALDKIIKNALYECYDIRGGVYNFIFED